MYDTVIKHFKEREERVSVSIDEGPDQVSQSASPRQTTGRRQEASTQAVQLHEAILSFNSTVSSGVKEREDISRVIMEELQDLERR